MRYTILAAFALMGVLIAGCSSSPSAPLTIAQAIQQWQNSGGPNSFRTVNHDLGHVDADLKYGYLDALEGIDDNGVDGWALNGDANNALADPPPGPSAYWWETAMSDYQNAGNSWARWNDMADGLRFWREGNAAWAHLHIVNGNLVPAQ